MNMLAVEGGYQSFHLGGGEFLILGLSIGLSSASSESALAAGLVMGIMILPLITSLSEDALFAVPNSLRDAAYALGSLEERCFAMLAAWLVNRLGGTRGLVAAGAVGVIAVPVAILLALAQRAGSEGRLQTHRTQAQGRQPRAHRRPAGLGVADQLAARHGGDEAAGRGRG